MNKKFIFGLFLLYTTVYGHSQEQNFRELALSNFVLESEQFNSFFNEVEKHHFLVSECSIEFDDLANFMQKEIKKVDISTTLDLNIDAKLKSSLGKRKAFVKVYFTEIKDGIFMCEVFRDSNKRRSGERSYIQGDSYVYLFKVARNKNIEHVKTIRFANN